MKKLKKDKSLKKIKKEEISEEVKIKNIVSSIRKKVSNFRKDHKVYIFCYPFGRRGSNKDGVDKSHVVRKYIYLCKSCKNKCREFDSKIYLCNDLNCKNWPICVYLSEEKMIKECKRVGHFDERESLNKKYVQFINLNQFCESFKKNPSKTLPIFEKYMEHILSKKKKKKKKNPSADNTEIKKNGKVQTKVLIKKAKSTGKRPKRKN